MALELTLKLQKRFALPNPPEYTCSFNSFMYDFLCNLHLYLYKASRLSLSIIEISTKFNFKELKKKLVKSFFLSFSQLVNMLYFLYALWGIH